MRSCLDTVCALFCLASYLQNECIHVHMDDQSRFCSQTLLHTLIKVNKRLYVRVLRKCKGMPREMVEVGYSEVEVKME